VNILLWFGVGPEDALVKNFQALPCLLYWQLMLSKGCMLRSSCH
jgi:hypothetical protein